MYLPIILVIVIGISNLVIYIFTYKLTVNCFSDKIWLGMVIVRRM